MENPIAQGSQVRGVIKIKHMGTENPSLWGEMGMRLKEGNLCNTLGSSFMAASIIFLVSSFVM
jgi:hypothetical protein